MPLATFPPKGSQTVDSLYPASVQIKNQLSFILKELKSFEFRNIFTLVINSSYGIRIDNTVSLQLLSSTVTRHQLSYIQSGTTQVYKAHG